jgi:parallel beta-helix repeat protein
MVRTLLVTCLTLASASTSAASAAASIDPVRSPQTLVVDDDRAQCAAAEFTTIQDAIDAAAPGGVVRVCPGMYTKTADLDTPLVTIDKPLTLRGRPNMIEAVDCFAATYSPADPTREVVSQAPNSSTTEPLVLVNADGVDLQGFVFQGVTIDTGRWAVETSPHHAGYRVHHNLFQSNLVAIRFGSSGDALSQFDHNCLRDNRFGFSTGFDHFIVDVRVHHNFTFRHTGSATATAYRLDPPFIAPFGTVNVTLDHNVSNQDFAAYHVTRSLATTLSKNVVEAAGDRGIHLGGGNHDLSILDNTITVRGRAGIAQHSNPLPPSNHRVVIEGNTVTGGTAAGIGMGIGALIDSTIADNVVTGNRAEGIALIAGNTGNVVSGNVVEQNGRNGIWAGLGATGNSFVGNEMHGNGSTMPGTADAHDDNDPINTWTDNVCETDIPAGAICGDPATST